MTKSLEEIDGKHRVKVPKAKKRSRTVDLSQGTVAVLARHRGAMRAEGRDVGTGIAFCDTIEGYLRISNVYRNSWSPLLKTAGLPDVTLYALRHTCATLLLVAGVNPKIVSERLGHSTVTLTLDTYTHVLPTMQRAAAVLMGRFLHGGPAAEGSDPGP